MEKRKLSLKEKLSASVFISVIGILFTLNLIIPSPEVLVSERRMPARFPELTLDSVYTGTFMKKFEDWAADHFVFRDQFRAVNAFLIFEVYRQSDKSGLYRSDAVGIGEFRRTNESSFRQTALRIQRAAAIFDELDMNIYYSLIPDKSVFAERYLPGFLMEPAENILIEMFADFDYIRIFEEMRPECFYRTDLHWDQSMIYATANKLVTSMGAVEPLKNHPAVIAGEFRGVYGGQYALPLAPDIMKYVDVPNLSVTYLNERTLEMDEGPVYDLVRFRGVDPYDIFLRGPQPLIIIENENAPQRELYIFRDSFGSSLAPLLTDAYSKIVLIDLRYIHLSLLEHFIEFTPGSDVLFIYGSQIFNNPTILQS